MQPDPGWQEPWKGVARRVVPVGRRALNDPIIVLRQLFLSFVVSLFLFQFVLLFLALGEPAKPGLALLLVGIGALVAVIGPRFAPRLSCESDAALASSYRNRFFVRIATSESAALLGFVAFFTANTWWSYPLGAAIALAGYWFAAPTCAHFARDQEALNAGGCGRSLVDALRGSHS